MKDGTGQHHGAKESPDKLKKITKSRHFDKYHQQTRGKQLHKTDVTIQKMSVKLQVWSISRIGKQIQKKIIWIGGSHRQSSTFCFDFCSVVRKRLFWEIRLLDYCFTRSDSFQVNQTGSSPRSQPPESCTLLQKWFLISSTLEEV